MHTLSHLHRRITLTLTPSSAGAACRASAMAASSAASVSPVCRRLAGCLGQRSMTGSQSSSPPPRAGWCLCWWGERQRERQCYSKSTCRLAARARGCALRQGAAGRLESSQTACARGSSSAAAAARCGAARQGATHRRAPAAASRQAPVLQRMRECVWRARRAPRASAYASSVAACLRTSRHTHSGCRALKNTHPERQALRRSLATRGRRHTSSRIGLLLRPRFVQIRRACGAPN